MSHMPVRMFVMLIFALVSACAVRAQPDARSLTVDDMLKVEGAGTALMDPGNRWVLFEKVRPYDQITDYSFRTYAYLKSGHQVWRYDIRSGGKAERLPGLDPDPHTYLQEFSPSGRYVSLLQYSFGELRLLAYDLENEETVTFTGTPAFSRTGEHNPLWLNDDELIYVALPEGEQPMATSVRAGTGRMLTEAWQDAWRGNSVTAREVRTRPVDGSAEQQPGRLIRAEAATGAERVLAEGLFADLRLSPGRRHLAALSVSRPGSPLPGRAAVMDLRRHRLTLFDLDTGAIRELAPDLNIFPYSLAWSPEGDRLAVFGWRHGEDATEGRFHVVDIRTGSVTRFEHHGLDLVSERERGWLQRPERTVFLGEALAVFARRIPEGEDQTPRFTFKEVGARGASRPDWYAITAGGAVRNLTNGLSEVSGVPVHAGDDHVTVLADGALYRISGTGQRKRLAPGIDGYLHLRPPGTFATRSSVIRPAFTDQALFDVTGAGRPGLALVGLGEENTGAYRTARLSSGEDVTALAGSLTGGYALFRSEDAAESVLSLVQTETPDKPVELARLNQHLSDVDLGAWKVVTYEVADAGSEGAPAVIESCVLLPPGYREGAPVPLVVDVYPNAGPRCKNRGARITYPDPDSPYIWAGKGYAYARLSGPHSLIRTQEGPIAGLDEIVEAGVDALVAEGIADPNRLVLTGFSQGGLSSLYVAAHSDRFGAVIAMHSWADLFSHYFGSVGVVSYLYDAFGTFSRYEAEAGSDFGLGATPFEDPETYYRNSPVFLATQISAPVLLVHSDMDSFPIYQFDEMYGALLRAGKDARYVRYWGEGHGLSSPANIRDLWSRIDLFLEDEDLAP